MRTVNEVSKITGVSIRTLHHYDAIGLLKPTKVTNAGYRLYDDTALCRLQSILLFRELQFPLKEIKTILDNPNFEPSNALEQQIKLLELQYKHIEKLISFAREIQKKGAIKMDFNVFDKSIIEQYKQEVKAKWGESEAYQEFIQREKNGMLRELPPSDKKVQEKICTLQRFITDNYYNCTNKILSNLGQMYVNDERFKKNIDSAGGEGTAEFTMQAIQIYCSAI